MGLRIFAWVIFLLMILFYGAGCSARVPGDGRLVLILVDADVADLLVPAVDSSGSVPGMVRLGSAICAGVRYWDEVGAHLRCPEDVAPNDPVEAASVRVVRAPAVDELFDDGFAWFNHVDGKIYAPTDRMLAESAASTKKFSYNSWASIFAHEAGHALGLQHEDVGGIIMNPNATWRSGLAPEDKAQFCAAAIHTEGACK